MASFDGRSTDLEPRLNLAELTNVKATGKIIGKGSFGRVVEVYVHETLCAAKEIHSILIEDVTFREFEGTKQLFLTECANASQVNHPNVVQVLGICYLNTAEASLDRRLPCLVMELMETSLTKFLDTYGRDRVPLHLKLSILVDVAQGLEFLHCNLNIIHRDLSSNNVLLTKGLVAKIADFGVAKVMKQNKCITQTRAPGTQYFMPPEALSVKPRYGKPVDVFSLACVVLHVMSHQWPQPVKDQVHMDPITNIATFINEAARREEYLNLCSPSSLKYQVELCLHNVSDQRPNISDLCKSLKRIKAEVDQKTPFSAATNIDLLDKLQEKELQIQKLLDTLQEKELQIQKLLDTLQERELQIQSLSKKQTDTESILAKKENDIQSRDQELQQLKNKVSNLQQQLDAQIAHTTKDTSNQLELSRGYELEETKITTKMKHGYHRILNILSESSSVEVSQFSNEGHRKQQMIGQSNRTRETEMREKWRPQQYGSVREAGKGYSWEDHTNGGMGQHTGKSPLGYTIDDQDEDVDPENMKFYKNSGNQGCLLIQDIKEGLRYNYTLQEIQLASEMGHRYQSHCDFLQREWNAIIECTSFRVDQLGEEFHRKKSLTGTIGKPQKKEIVKALIEEHGDSEKAAQRCCANRIKMIQDLMRETELPQSAAVMALERNDLDMDKAICAVYREKINSNALYAYIWGELEGGGIQKKQNDRYLQRLLMAEYKLQTCGNCDVLIHLVRDYNLTVGACLDVAMVSDNVEAAIQLLTQECPICYEEYMRDKMINMIHCDHAVCKECFVDHFSLVVGEKSIKHFNCPVCMEPDMSSETIDMDLYLQMFGGLIQAHMSKEHYNLCTQKINERTLMKDPKFSWCIKCTSGFINDAGRDKVECPNPDCKQQMCFRCKKPWETAHDGITCEQFAAWKKDNDPALQAQGLAAYLNEEGIECPACKFKYALAKGGCMHFKCNQCPAEFCSGCGNLFKKDCTKYESCRNRGLHTHHPRDCLFFLRDESVENLQKLLDDNNVEYDTEPPEGQVMAEAKKGIQALQGQEGEVDQPVAPPAAAPVLKCHVMLQKEAPDGPPIDEECDDAVEYGHAGLCLKHYKEYLVYKINQYHIDPLPLFETGQLRAILYRNEVKVPDQQIGESEEQYAERLRQLIKERLPLEEREVKNF